MPYAGRALIHKSMGMVVTMQIGGVVASIPGFSMLAGMFRRKMVITFVLTIISAVLTGNLVDRMV